VKQRLIDRIRKKDVTIAVVGLGYVGLPMAAVLAKTGYRVVGVDTDQHKIELLRNGKSYLNEPGLAEMLRRIKHNITVTCGIGEGVSKSQVVIVCVPTGVSAGNRPDLSALFTACDDIAAVLQKKSLILIVSTVPAGTTRQVIARIETVSGLKYGDGFFCAHCPERVYPGRAIKELMNNDRIVGADENKSAQLAAELLSAIIKGKVHVTSAVNAELAKLAENAYRDVNIAFANELALISENVHGDVMEVISLANTHPRVKIHKPGCGVGGPCLPKDPYYLTEAFGGKPPSFDIIRRSRELNDYMPTHFVEFILDALRTAVQRDAKHPKIAVLGVTYKGGTDDVRNSPAEIVVRQLLKVGGDVHVYDPFSTETFGAKKANTIDEALSNAQCLIICADHSEFLTLEMRRLKQRLDRNAIVVDGRRVLDASSARRVTLKYFGIGFGVANPNDLALSRRVRNS
jgi:UDP-N-acetyl-D-mannosaminuronic acid dehydrogenase